MEKNEVLSRLTSGYLPKYIPKRLIVQKQKILTSMVTCIQSKLIMTTVLMGPRKSGKSLTLNHCIDELKKNYQLNVIYLSSSWIQNESMCYRLVGKALGKDLEVDTKDPEFLVEALQKKCTDGFTPIFILDDFDEMIVSCRKFIYSLLDTQHYSGIHMSIFMITQNYGFSDYLDRRITSRLGMVIIYFFPLVNGVDYVREILSIEKNTEWNKRVDDLCNSTKLVEYLEIHQGYGIEFLQNYLRRLVSLDVWNYFPEKVTRLQVLKDLPINDVITFLIIKKIVQTSNKKFKTPWVITKYREFLFGTKKQENSVFYDVLLSSTRNEDTLIKKSITQLENLELISINKDFISMKVHPNEVDRFMNDNISNFPSELRSLV